MRSGCLLASLLLALFLTVFSFAGMAVVVPATPTPSATCAYAWATMPLPALAAQLNEALADNGLSNVTASVSAFGENCIGPDGTVRDFLMSEVTYSLTLPLTQAGLAAGDLARQALNVWQLASTPSPAPNERIELRFEGGDQVIIVETNAARAREALAQAITGNAFIDALLISP